MSSCHHEYAELNCTIIYLLLAYNVNIIRVLVFTVLLRLLLLAYNVNIIRVLVFTVLLRLLLLAYNVNIIRVLVFTVLLRLLDICASNITIVLT